MARFSGIVRLSEDDGPQLTARKCNENFEALLSLSKGPSKVAGFDVDAIAEALAPAVVNRVMAQVYPVGCIICASSVSDPRLANGTWVRVFGGKVVMGASSGRPSGSTGGSDWIEGEPSGTVSMDGPPDAGSGYRLRIARGLSASAPATVLLSSFPAFSGIAASDVESVSLVLSSASSDPASVSLMWNGGDSVTVSSATAQDVAFSAEVLFRGQPVLSPKWSGGRVSNVPEYEAALWYRRTQ